jgi:hypothetical protein
MDSFHANLYILMDLYPLRQDEGEFIQVKNNSALTCVHLLRITIHNVGW